MRGTVRERLYARLAPCADPACDCDGCLLWSGGRWRSGYGYIGTGGRKRGVHLVAWELEKGPVPDGLVLDHVRDRGCRHRHCAEVAHLEPVTIRENILRGNGVAAAHAAQTHCKNGHLFDEANTYWRPRGGGRDCRACHRAQYMTGQWRARRRHRTAIT